MPLASVVTPKTLPFPLDRNVTRFPLTVAVAFQAEENCCGEVRASTTVQLVAPLTVTSVLNRSAHLVPSRNVVVQPPPGDGLADGDREALGEAVGVVVPWVMVMVEMLRAGMLTVACPALRVTGCAAAPRLCEVATYCALATFCGVWMTALLTALVERLRITSVTLSLPW